MIAFVKGFLEEKEEDHVVLEVNGIGYNLYISGRTYEALPPLKSEIKLYTYTCVREDAFLLYGFLTKEELRFYKMLITVNGIGPKGGLAILSVLSPDDLRFAILSGDVKTIAKAPGIGNKTAGRVILDLKDKVSIDPLIPGEMTGSAGDSSFNEENQARQEAIEALTALGYSPSDAIRAVQKADPPSDADTELILKLALKAMY